MEMSTLPNMQLEELDNMLEKKQDGIYIDTETNQIVFEYDELDEASQRSLDTLSKSIRENPPPPTPPYYYHKNQVVLEILAMLGGEVREMEWSNGMNDWGGSNPYEYYNRPQGLMAEELFSILKTGKEFEDMLHTDVISFVTDFYVKKNNDGETFLRMFEKRQESSVLSEAEENEMEYWRGQFDCSNLFLKRLKERYA